MFFSLERIEVAGKSPFYEAMVVCLAAFHGKGKIIIIIIIMKHL